MNKFFVDLLSEACIVASAAIITDMIATRSMGLLLLGFSCPPLYLAVGCFIAAYFLKLYVDDGRLNRSLGDCITSFILDMA